MNSFTNASQCQLLPYRPLSCNAATDLFLSVDAQRLGHFDKLVLADIQSSCVVQLADLLARMKDVE